MTNQERFKFENNGKPYEIIIGGISREIGVALTDGNLYVRDDDVVSVKLISEDICSGRFIKRNITTYHIEVAYKLSSFGDTYTENISVASGEVAKAEEACKKAASMIDKMKAEKEAYKKRQDELIAKARAEDTIDAIDVNGKTIKIWRKETFFRELVLIVDGGETYHTHADCFESWKPMYRRNFTGWKIVDLEEAKSQGLNECKLCQKYYDIEE